MRLYNGKYQLEFNEATHRYKINGEYKTGVTTMLSMLSKDGLIQWAANMVCDWIKDNCTLDSLRQYLVSGEQLREAKYAHVRKRDKSADTGKAVHLWIENHLKGQDGEITPDMRPSVDAYLQWETANQPEVLHSEKVLFSEQHDYCGTADVVFKLNGKVYMADFKTSKPEMEWKKAYTGRVRARNEHLLQCALYDQAYAEEHGENCDAYMVIYVTKEGELHTFAADNTKQLRETAISVVNAYKLTKNINFNNKYRSK